MCDDGLKAAGTGRPRAGALRLISDRVFSARHTATGARYKSLIRVFVFSFVFAVAELAAEADTENEQHQRHHQQQNNRQVRL